jgi:hypothetical protein
LNMRLARLPAFSAISIPAITISVNVDVNIRNAQTKRKKRPPRSRTAPVRVAFLYYTRLISDRNRKGIR